MLNRIKIVTSLLLVLAIFGLYNSHPVVFSSMP